MINSRHYTSGGKYFVQHAVSDACRRGALRARKSGQTWLITVADMLRYQNGRYWPDAIPDELKPAYLERLLK